ncbi:hypothetical protein AB1N83_013987 [Pleurotus pulmonarius]|nr:hypothetical protein EYR38_010761 [Pleurotus pulmonarius]
MVEEPANSRETRPPKKRRRSSTVSTRSSPPARLVRDKVLYFTDGSVILAASGDADDASEVQELISASDTNKLTDASRANGPEKGPEDDDQVMQDAPAGDGDTEENITVYFRVHKSLLVGESALFEELIEKNSCNGSNLNKHFGVPVVILADKAKDVRGFLRAIYKPYMIFLSRYDPRSAALLSGPLVLAAKYKADALKDRIVAHINADWPSESFLEWKQRSDNLPEEDAPDPEQLVHLARTTGLTADLGSALAVAYYTMLSFSPSSLQTELLHAKDCVKLMEARSRIDTWLWAWISEAPSGSSDDSSAQCAKGPKLGSSCEKCRLSSFRDRVLLEWMKFSRDSADVIEYLESASQGLNEKSSGIEFCCKRCRLDAGKWLKAVAKAFCERLEDIFADEKPDIDRGSSPASVDADDLNDLVNLKCEGDAADTPIILGL